MGVGIGMLISLVIFCWAYGALQKTCPSSDSADLASSSEDLKVGVNRHPGTSRKCDYLVGVRELYSDGEEGAERNCTVIPIQQHATIIPCRYSVPRVAWSHSGELAASQLPTAC